MGWGAPASYLPEQEGGRGRFWNPSRGLSWLPDLSEQAGLAGSATVPETTRIPESRKEAAYTQQWVGPVLRVVKPPWAALGQQLP